MSNLKQLGTALDMYRADNGDYPIAGSDAFNAYIGGAKLQCPELARHYNFSAYLDLVQFSTPVSGKFLTSYRENLIACFEKRGPDFPLVADLNHIPKLLHEDNLPNGFALVYRASGGVQKVSKNRVAEINLAMGGVGPPAILPCDPGAQFGNL